MSLFFYYTDLLYTDLLVTGNPHVVIFLLYGPSSYDLLLLDIGVNATILVLALGRHYHISVSDSAHRYVRDSTSKEPLLPTSSVLWSGFPR
jgi:hypothetical protein